MRQMNLNMSLVHPWDLVHMILKHKQLMTLLTSLTKRCMKAKKNSIKKKNRAIYSSIFFAKTLSKKFLKKYIINILTIKKNSI